MPQYFYLIFSCLFQNFKGSPEEQGSPIAIPVDFKFVPLKELIIKITITNEDGEEKPTKAVDVSVKGCILGKKGKQIDQV